MHMAIKPGFRVGGGIGANIAGVAVRWIKGKEMGLLFNTANDNQCLAKVRLPMSGGDGSAGQTSPVIRASWPAHSL